MRGLFFARFKAEKTVPFVSFILKGGMVCANETNENKKARNKNVVLNKKVCLMVFINY
jgi:hypothetical protein